MPDSSGVGGFAGGFLSSYANGLREVREKERLKEEQMTQGRLGVLQTMANNPDIQADPEALKHIFQLTDETLNGQQWQTQQKSGKGGGKNKAAGHLTQLAHIIAPLGSFLAGHVQKKQLKPLDIQGYGPGSTAMLADGTPLNQQQNFTAPADKGLGQYFKTPEQRQALDIKLQQEKIAPVDTWIDSQVAAGNMTQREGAERKAEARGLKSLPNRGASGQAKPISAQLKGSDKWVPIQQDHDEEGNIVYRRLSNPKTGAAGDPIDPEDITALGPPPRNYNRNSQQWIDLHSLALDRVKKDHPDWNADQQQASANQTADEAFAAFEQQKYETGSTGLSGRNQAIGVTAGQSGIGPGNRGPSTPSLLNRGSTTTSTPSTKANSTGAAVPTQPSTTQMGVESTRPMVGNGTATNAAGQQKQGVQRSPIVVQRAMDSDPDMQNTRNWLQSGAKQSNLDAKGGIRIRSGLKKLEHMTGLSEDQLRIEGKGRAEAYRLIDLTSARLESYGELSMQIDAVGKQFEAAQKKFANDPRRWRQIKNYIAKNFTGDPDTAELVTAANEFQRVYARFSSGAAQSTGQTHVGPQEAISEMVDAASSGGWIGGVLKQVEKGANNDLNAYKSAIKQARTELQKPWGEFDVTKIIADIGSGGNSGGGKPSEGDMPSKFTIGQSVTLKDGKTVKVKKVYSDGTFDPE